MNNTCLVVAAHPDDEVLGIGGTLARHAAEGDSVHVLILADGISSRSVIDEAEAKRRSEAASCAAKALGINPPLMLDYPDNRLDTVPLLDIIKRIEAMIEKVSPNIMYIHHGGDLNVDHRIAHEAAMTAARPQPGGAVRAIYAFETPSSTEWASDNGQSFRPSRYVDISSYFLKKLAALECYGEEMRPFPHARSIEALEALASMRGASVGTGKAEAFLVIREIIPA